jgi:hypothetical protein
VFQFHIQHVATGEKIKIFPITEKLGFYTFPIGNKEVLEAKRTIGVPTQETFIRFLCTNIIPVERNVGVIRGGSLFLSTTGILNRMKYCQAGYSKRNAGGCRRI